MAVKNNESYQAYFKSLSELYRLMIIDKCLSGTKPMSMEDIQFECNEFLSADGMKEVHINTIRGDFENLKEFWNVEIEKVRDKKNIRYRYSDPDFSVFKVIFDVDQMQEMQSMVQFLFYFNKMQGMEWTKELADHLQNAFGLQWMSDESIDYDINPKALGSDMLMPLVGAIGQRKAVTITYKAFRWEDSRDLIVHPYFLKQYRNCWYLLGLNAETMAMQTYGLDRVTYVETAEDVSYISTDMDFNKYFSEIIGVTRNIGTLPRNIVLDVSKKLWPYWLNQPLHHSQKLLEEGETEKTVRVRLKVCENTELYKMLLSNIQEIEIVEPLDLRERMEKILEKALNKHKS